MPYYRRNLYVLTVTIFLTAVSWNQIVPFLPLFLKELGTRPEHLVQWSTGIFALQAAAAIIAHPFWGKLGDRYGRKPMVLRAGVCLAGIYYGMSFCTAPWQLATFRFLNGALTGFIPGSFALLATNTPSDEAPKALATAQTSAAAGTIIGPALGGLLAALAGYRGSMQVSGTAVLLSTLLVLLLVKEPNKPRVTDKTSLLQDFAISLNSPILVSIMITVMLQGGFGAAVAPMLALHLAALGGGQSPDWVTGVVFALPAVAFVLTARLWTKLGESWGYDRVIVVGLLGGAAVTIVLVFAHNVMVFGTLYFLAGIWLAAISPATAAVICLKVDENFRGRAYGMQSSATMFGALLFPIAAGQIGAAFGLNSIFLMISASFIVGSFVFRMFVRGWDTDKLRPEVQNEPILR